MGEDQIGEITVPVQDLTERKTLSLVREMGSFTRDDRNIDIMLASRRIEFWVTDREGKARYFGVELGALSRANCALILAHLDLEGRT